MKKYALRKTLSCAEAAEFIAEAIKAPFTVSDLLGYCRDRHLSAYVLLREKPVVSDEIFPLADGQGTQRFSASGLHKVISPERIGISTPGRISYCGEGRVADEPEESTFSCQIYWSEEGALQVTDLVFHMSEVKALASDLGSAAKPKLDPRMEHSIGQIIAGIAAKGGVDLYDKKLHSDLTKRGENGEIAFDLCSDTFKKFIQMGKDFVIDSDAPK